MKKKKTFSAKNITHFLIISMIAFAVFCVAVFGVVFSLVKQKSSETLESVADTYMAGISEQINQHFKTAIELRLSQLELVANTVPESDRTRNNMIRTDETLENAAQTHGFEYLGFMSDVGNLEKIYGKDITFYDKDSLLVSLNNDESKVAMATDEDGNSILIVAISVIFPMTDGENGTALMGGIPVSYISDKLNLEENNEKVYSFIVRRDGSFVFRTKTVVRNNYFDRIRDLYQDTGGKTAEQYIEEIQYAMDHNETYASDFWLNGERRRLYMTPLDYSDWYLVSFMPFGEINRSIDALTSSFTLISIIACIAIILALFFIFLRVFILSKRQMKLLQKAELEAQNASRSKSEFLSHMSHDIRTPMNAIVGMTEIAKMRIDDREELNTCLDRIQLSSKHLMSLINDVLDMSKIESGKLMLSETEVSLTEALENIKNIVRIQADQKQQILQVDVHDIENDYVISDPVRLNQMSMNLLSNALKFTPAEGTVGIEMYQEASEKGDAYIRTHLIVWDTGIGMSEEFLEHIFDSFAREDQSYVRQVEGTGLGMSITKHIVDAMGGTIDIQSKKGEGSRFHIAVDLKKAAHTESSVNEQNPEKDLSVLQGKRILLAEDNELNREIAEAVLSELGLEVTSVENGRLCVEKFEESEPGYYALILMDVRMPEMNGHEATQEIRELSREDAQIIPIIAMSADAFSDDVKKSIDSGMNAHISKPLDMPVLIQTLLKYIS